MGGEDGGGSGGGKQDGGGSGRSEELGEGSRMGMDRRCGGNYGGGKERGVYRKLRKRKEEEDGRV